MSRGDYSKRGKQATVEAKTTRGWFEAAVVAQTAIRQVDRPRVWIKKKHARARPFTNAGWAGDLNFVGAANNAVPHALTCMFSVAATILLDASRGLLTGISSNAAVSATCCSARFRRVISEVAQQTINIASRTRSHDGTCWLGRCTGP